MFCDLISGWMAYSVAQLCITGHTWSLCSITYTQRMKQRIKGRIKNEGALKEVEEEVEEDKGDWGDKSREEREDEELEESSKNGKAEEEDKGEKDDENVIECKRRKRFWRRKW